MGMSYVAYGTVPDGRLLDLAAGTTTPKSLE